MQHDVNRLHRFLCVAVGKYVFTILLYEIGHFPHKILRIYPSIIDSFVLSFLYAVSNDNR